AFYLPYLLIFVSISGSIWLIYKIFQTRYSLKGSKIRFKRFFFLGFIFYLIIVSSGLFGVLEGNKRVSRSILLGNVTQKYESARDKKKKEQALAQKMEEFTTCYEEMNDIFVNQEKRLTDKNMEKLTRLYQNLPEKQQKEVQDKKEKDFSLRSNPLKKHKRPHFLMWSFILQLKHPLVQQTKIG
ncbi:hypothetical protein LF861_14350, partial [Enterococcus faecium]|nr:hypothetical protein [Enterococcus faecium]MCA6686800.1 hypothetical protein [Enterococcus faecium]MCA6695518.1 hypothetical protein [Enterococcus faecium]